MLWGILEFIRDIAILAAAVGIAKWTWDQHSRRLSDQEHTDRIAEARTREIAELQAAASGWGTKMETFATGITAQLDELVQRQREMQDREILRLAIHRVLHETKDHFLTIKEIADIVATSAPHLPTPHEAEIRHALISLIADGVVAQMEGDRYFVATDYEADDDDDGLDV